MGKPKLHIYHRKHLDQTPLLADSPAVRAAFHVTRGPAIPSSCDLVFAENNLLELAELKKPYAVYYGGHYWYEWRGTPSKIETVERVFVEAKRVICISKFLADMTHDKVPDAKVTYLPGGLWGTDHVRYKVNAARFTPKTTWTIRGRPKIAMCMSLNGEIKWRGLPRFMKAAWEVIKKHDAVVTCCGRIKRQQKLASKWATAWGLKYINWSRDGGAYDFTIGIGDTVWPSVLAQADMFVHPSIWDSWGCAVADAMMTGVPGLVFDVTGQREVGTTFVRCNPASNSDITSKLDRLLADGVHRSVVGKAMLAEAELKMVKHRGDFARILKEVLG
jgi:glycosyltransferase involved in cell wall biosynthesis